MTSINKYNDVLLNAFHNIDTVHSPHRVRESIIQSSIQTAQNSNLDILSTQLYLDYRQG